MRNPWKLTSFALAAALAASAIVPSVLAEPQPKMREALDSLRAAERSLSQATHDKGGHRVKALQLTKQAIDEVQAGIKFDNKH
ncbi:MAG TPA: hypothetical protein VNO30_07415 [Kofleriaceae bacterium]|nr:hypothetical protein [Kofleriaceae bacterium]